MYLFLQPIGLFFSPSYLIFLFGVFLSFFTTFFVFPNEQQAHRKAPNLSHFKACLCNTDNWNLPHVASLPQDKEENAPFPYLVRWLSVMVWILKSQRRSWGAWSYGVSLEWCHWGYLVNPHIEPLYFLQPLILHWVLGWVRVYIFLLLRFDDFYLR